MASAQIFAFVALLFCAYAQAQVKVDKCPAVNVKTDFVVANYVGKWYEQLSVTPTDVCNIDYTALSDTRLGITMNRATDPKTVTGYADIKDGQADVYLSNRPNVTVYTFLEAVYDQYAVVSRCDQTESGAFLYLFCYSRVANPGQEIIDACKKVAADQGLPVDSLQMTNQAQCSN